jgi:protein TonB
VKEQIARAAAQQRNTNQGVDESRQIAERLRGLEAGLAALRNALAERDAMPTVLPTPTTPFDGSRQLVSPSGRAPIRVGGTVLDKMPVPTKQVQPVYAAEVMRARIQGTVAVEVLVDEQGKVVDARVLRSIPQLDDAAVVAAKQWEFTPTLLNGEPVPVLLMLEMNFLLR